MNSHRLSSKVLFIVLIACVLFIPSSSTEIIEPIRDGDYIYIDDSKTFLKSTYLATHGQDIEHWAMTKQFTGDCDMAIGFDGEVAWPTKVLLEDWHYKNTTSNTSHTFYYVTNFASTTDTPDYGNLYNPHRYKFDHKIHIGYDNATNESIWQDVIGTVAYFDSQTNDGMNYTITWHTKHSRLEQYRDISNRILVNPINYEFDEKNLWFITKNIPMAANEMRKIVIEMDGKIELGEQSYKYDIIWKPSHQTIAEAKAAGNLYVLDPYWNTSWQWYVEYTINHSMVDQSQTNFPVQLFFNIDGFKDDAADLRVTDGSGNQLAREIDFYSSTTNNGSVFFNMTSLSNTTDDVIRLYGGNPSATEPAAGSTHGSEAVWDNNYVYVSHMADLTTSSIIDSTSNKRTSTKLSANNPIEYDAPYGKAQDFSSDYVTIADSVDFDFTDFTFESYHYKDVDAAGAIMSKMYDGSARSWECVDSSTSDRMDGAVNAVGTPHVVSATNSVTIQNWYYTALRHDDSGTSQWYVDGAASGSAVDIGAVNANAAGVKIGDRAHPSSRVYFDGKIAEVRISNILRSAGYVATTSNNIHNPTASGISPFFTSFGEKEFFIDSLYYNATTPYNITIESDGTLTSNRSIIAADDTNWTANSTGTTYWQHTTAVQPSGYSNFTISGDSLNNFTATNLTASTQYDLKNSSGTVESQTTDSDGVATFEVDLVAGDYWVEHAGFSIVLLSQTPSIIYQNSTGYLNISYGITHSSAGLNNTSISFIFRGYDYDCACSNHSIRVPSNNLAAEWDVDGRILRGINRNETLNFENNATITGGDIYSWSGMDENSTGLTIVPVNSTYTKVYLNKTMHCFMPQMWYLDRSDLRAASKTQLPIHKTQNVLIKFWELEIFKGNTDFLGVGYTDTSLNSNPALWPSDANPVNFYYINSSYDPATGGDPITSGYAVYMGSLNASGWTDHVWSPHANSNYVRGFIDNNYLHSVINTTNISYLYFTSNTESSKPYYLNMTNVASSTNISFANTNVLWAGNNPPFTSQSYTPNVWFAFMKLNMSLDHKLYAADNNDLWGNSTMSRTNITQALFPPTTPSFYAFHNEFQDVDMNGTYHDTIQIQVSAGSDPDGGVVIHNITLHYGNKTHVATINGSAVAENGVYTNITFNTTPYYSQIENYTLRVIATDDESETVTVWLGVNFSLDGSPRIISYSPETPVTTNYIVSQTFSITTNLPGNVTWYLDSVKVFNETSVSISNYSNSNATARLHNVTVITTNTNGSNSMEWEWTVDVGHNPLLLNFYIIITGFALLMTGYTFLVNDINNYTNIITGYLSGVLYFIAGYYAYIGIGISRTHETSSYSGGVITSTMTSTAVTSYQYDWLGSLFIVVGIIMILYSIVQSIGITQNIISDMESSPHDL